VDDESHDEEPRVGKPLPNAESAHIDLTKLVRYALDRSSPDGRHKARVFSSALAIEQQDAEYLRDAILEQLPSRVATGFRPPSRPMERPTWEVKMPIRGLNNRTLIVITAWEIVAGRPQLVTTRVESRRRQSGLH
jgi:uncharacterized protein